MSGKSDSSHHTVSEIASALDCRSPPQVRLCVFHARVRPCDLNHTSAHFMPPDGPQFRD